MQTKNVMDVTAKSAAFWQLFHDEDPKMGVPHSDAEHVVEARGLSKKVLTANPVAQGADPSVVLAAEQYRLLRTRVLHISRSKRGNVFLITSALAGDGKTLTAINLAYSLASLPDKRVLYVELDLRRPSAHTVLGVRSEPGDHTFLESEKAWRECTRRMKSNLDMLLAYNPSRTPNETLHRSELASFLEEAAKEYDTVILDTAPLLAAIDTEAILPLVKNVLFLIRANKTPIDCVRDALALVGDKIVGTVLNDTKNLKYRDYYYSYQSPRT